MTHFFGKDFTFAQLLTFGRGIRKLQRHIPFALRFHLRDLRKLELYFEALGQDQPIESFRSLIDDPSLREVWVEKNLELYEEDRGKTWSEEHNTPPPQGAFNDRGTLKDLLGVLIKASVGGWVRDERMGEEPPRGVFNNVHQTDGKGAWSENINRGRAIFVDDDDGKLNPEFVKKLLHPSIIVKSKRGYHYYWVTTDLSTEEIVVYQYAIATRLGTDTKVTDAARILRTPGFIHSKDANDLFKVVCEYVNPDLRYTKAQVVEAFQLDLKEARREKKHTSSDRTGPVGVIEIPDEILAIEGRVEAYIKKAKSRPIGLEDGRKFGAYMLGAFAGDYGVSPVEAFPIIKAWNDKNLPPLDEAQLEYRMHRGYKSRKSPIGNRLKKSKAAPGDAPKKEIPDSEHFDESLIMEKGENTLDYLTDIELEPRTHLILCLPQGSGKTEYGNRLVSATKSALVVTPRTALTVNMSGRYDIANYQHTKKADKLSTTVHSLHKIKFDDLRKSEKGYEREIYIVDEADKVLDAISERTNSNPAKLRNELFFRATHSKNSIWMSADMTQEYAHYIAGQLKQNDPNCKIVFVYQESNKKLRVRDIGLPAAEAEFYDACANKDPDSGAIVCFVTSKDKPFKLQAAAKKLNPSLRIIAITSKNAHEPWVQALLREPDRLVTEYDVLIASPTIGIGVNITEEVSEVYLLHSNRSIPGADMAQMMGRCRNISNNTVIYGCKNFKKRYDDTSDEYFEQLAIGYADITDTVISNIVERDLIVGRKQIVDENLFECWKMKKRRELMAENDPRGDLYIHICRHGWTYDDTTTKMTSQEKALLRTCTLVAEEDAERRKLERAEKISNATDYTQEEAENISRQYQKTQEESYGVEKFRISEFYGEEVDVDLVLLDDEGTFRKKIDRYTRAAILAQDSDGLNTLAKIEHVDTNNTHAIQYRHKLLQTMVRQDLYREILGHPFGDPSNDTCLVKATPESRQTISNIVQDKKRERVFRELMRHKLFDESKAFLMFNAMAKADGVEVNRVQYQCAETDETRNMYIYNTSLVRRYSGPHRKRLIEKSKRAKNDLEWRGFLDAVNGVT